MTTLMLLMCAFMFTLLASIPIMLVPKLDPAARATGVAIIFISMMGCVVMTSIVSTSLERNGRPVSHVETSKESTKSK